MTLPGGDRGGDLEGAYDVAGLFMLAVESSMMAASMLAVPLESEGSIVPKLLLGRLSLPWRDRVTGCERFWNMPVP